MDGWSVDWPATNADDITRPESTPLSIKRSIELHRPTTVVKQQLCTAVAYLDAYILVSTTYVCLRRVCVLTKTCHNRVRRQWQTCCASASSSQKCEDTTMVMEAGSMEAWWWKCNSSTWLMHAFVESERNAYTNALSSGDRLIQLFVCHWDPDWVINVRERCLFCCC